MPEPETIDIAMCFDRGHAVGALAALHSITANAARPEDIVFHVTTGAGEAPALEAILGRYFPRPVFRYEVREFRPDPFLADYIRAGQAHTYAAYESQVMNFSRFHLHDLYPGLDKVIYLDVDLVAAGDVAELHRLATLEEHPIAAVTVGDFTTRQGRFDPRSPLLEGFDLGAPAFNNGIYVTRLERWREDGYRERLYEWMRLHRDEFTAFVFGTQTLMNLVFYRDFEPLPPEWNLRPLGWHDDVPAEVLDRAKILHWAGKRKPWLPDGLYRSYWEPWALARPEDLE